MPGDAKWEQQRQAYLPKEEAPKDATAPHRHQGVQLKPSSREADAAAKKQLTAAEQNRRALLATTQGWKLQWDFDETLTEKKWLRMMNSSDKSMNEVQRTERTVVGATGCHMS